MSKPNWIAKIFPHPLVSVMVGLSWLMLSHSVDASDLLLALLLAIIIPKTIRRFITYTPNIHWLSAIRLLFVVLWDIVVSNFMVAKLVLGPQKNLHPQWFRVPLETQHEQVNSLLAMIITTTPGTVSAGIDQERRDILVHALSTDDPEADIQMIKRRYEAPLMHIFHVHTEDTP
ncbi:Na+/H+ antiporter subunit E [Acinetobacter sp. MD2(2019)]|uniref:Na+/H+ antiporter subunit E n=1 Tax=Acinetobacter sp. MD2(2019) TaxID=2605273 RepID=UPI002D1F0E90|nr:Na+/H+ antiporter subunit E [Acinetobacter sp. MD2(2019)]MEB3753226.1 Na+/H+ antiporter subunit E [Acinetobacter sp. MD2(2019)]